MCLSAEIGIYWLPLPTHLTNHAFRLTPPLKPFFFCHGPPSSPINHGPIPPYKEVKGA